MEGQLRRVLTGEIRVLGEVTQRWNSKSRQEGQWIGKDQKAGILLARMDSIVILKPCSTWIWGL